MTEPHEQDLPEPDDTPLAPDETEAEEAEEAGQPEPEPDDDDAAEPEPEPEPVAQGITPEQHEARLKKLDTSFATYSRRVQDVLGEDADDLTPCPLCLDVPRGFVYTWQAGRVPEEQADVVKLFLGLARPVDYPETSRFRACRECQGLGKVATGSKVPQHETITCPGCNGYGYEGETPRAQAAPTNGSEGMTGPTVYTEPTSPPDVDMWKQPRLLPDGRENPNWGRTPDLWQPVEPWGDTRGLTAQDAVRSAS
jgi:hypothetical protein